MNLACVISQGFKVRIVMDEFDYDPRGDDNLGTMVCSHRRYRLGDEQAWNVEGYSSWDQWLDGEILKTYGEGNVIYLPLYLYDHSGLRMNTVGFSCPWDSGQVGWIYVTRERAAKETGCAKRAREILQDEVATYDRYLSGCSSYGYIVEDMDNNVVESCGGFMSVDEIKDHHSKYSDLLKHCISICDS